MSEGLESLRTADLEIGATEWMALWDGLRAQRDLPGTRQVLVLIDLDSVEGLLESGGFFNLRGAFGRCVRLLLKIVGQKYLEDRSRAALRPRSAAAQVDQPLVLYDDAVAYPQAQTGAGGFFGGKECLEDVRAHRRLHAAAGVGYGKANALARGLFPVAGAAGADNDAASGCGCVDGVADQVGKNLAQLAGEAEKIESRIVIPLDLNPEAVQPPLVEAED